jgi:hypothetical protein
MALAARFGVIDVIASPDRTIHHGKAAALREEVGTRKECERSRRGTIVAAPPS